MLVNVIIAVYNGEKYLGETIESVLAQTYSPIELIIVDDGSQDGTKQVVQKYASKVRYFYQLNQGQPSAMNRGILMAKGSYIAFLDADDLYMPDKTALQVQCLEAKPQLDFVFGYVEQFFSAELPLEMRAKWSCPSGSAPGYSAVSGLFRRECFERVGLFNEQQRIGAFIEWYMRAAEQGLKNEMLPNQVFRRRIHGNNMGICAQHPQLEYLKIIKAARERRL